jgi:uncharacterized protein YndB with AHSA1/START domain
VAISTLHIAAPPSAVFRVLADGWVYSQWVVGTSHMRAVDHNWPAVGSELHHASGIWPFVGRDKTIVEDVVDDNCLHLTARLWPFGQADVRLTLSPDGAGTRVEMGEEPTGPAGRLLRNPLGERLVRRRNDEALQRLRALVERPASPD